MASPATAIAQILKNLEKPHKIQSALMQLKDLDITENIIEQTGARNKVGRLISDSFFGPLARSILNEWENQIIELTPPPSPSSSISSSSDDVESKIMTLLSKLSDPLEFQIDKALKAIGDLEVTREILVRSEARKKILDALFTRKLVRTPTGRLASAITARWSEYFSDFSSRSATPERCESPVVVEKNDRKRRSSDASSTDQIKKFRSSSDEDNREMFCSRKSGRTKVYSGKQKSSEMIPRPSSSVSVPSKSACQNVTRSEDAKLEEIKRKIAQKRTENKHLQTKTLQISAVKKSVPLLRPSQFIAARIGRSM